MVPRRRTVRGVTSAPLLVDRADVRVTDKESTLVLGAAGMHVLYLPLRYDAAAEEVINSAGLVAPGAVNAWTLIDHDMSLELQHRAAAVLGLPRDLRLHLNVGADTIRQVRTSLLEILQCACFVVDTADGRITG